MIIGVSVRGCSSVGRASALQAEGQRFDSAHLHQLKILMKLVKDVRVGKWSIKNFLVIFEIFVNVVKGNYNFDLDSKISSRFSLYNI